MDDEDSGRAAYSRAVRRFGRETFSFSGLKRGDASGASSAAMRYWAEGDDAAAYAAIGRTWVAVGSPLGPDPDRAARGFEAAAARAGCRVCCFAAERVPAGLCALPIGKQPIFTPEAWAATLRGSKSLREQLRRARKKGVVVRAIAPAELAPGEPLAARVNELARAWLDAHHLEPMGFLIAVEPFYAAGDHRYWAAERDGELVAFLSAVPIPGRRGWLVEDLYRDAGAPNGTTETLFDAFVRSVPDAEVVTLGLSPLAGDVPWWLRLARTAARPLYDFTGLRRFKERLGPTRWEAVYLAHPRGRGLLSLFASLRAFASGHLVSFAARSLLRHPSGPPFLLGLPLVPWTLVLAVIALAGHAERLAFTTAGLWAWVAFDALLATALYRAARRPRYPRLVLATALGGVDALLSLRHLALTGFGSGAFEALLRGLATLAPIAGTFALLWALRLARTRAQPAKPPLAR